MSRTRRRVPEWVSKEDQELIRLFRNGHASGQERLNLKGIQTHSVEWHIRSPQGKTKMKRLLARKNRRKERQRGYDAA